MKAERGFTLVEFLVVAALVAILTLGVVTLTFAQHPSELLSATRSFDASLAAARAIAATSGNGATIVVAPRTQTSTQKKPFPGFTLTVYRGRPTAANAVSSTTVMPIVSDIPVKETTLGSPPFSIFLSSAGHASGLAGYPSFDSSGKPVFSTIAQEPVCPNGSLALTFTNGNATQTRTLPCGVFVTGSPQAFATATPSPVTLTPNTLVFYWPGAPRQTFVATEWGYTRWFAANNFACGANVAAFPPSNPAPPYSAPYSTADADATPQPSPNVPYAFANSVTSMEDAPALFPIVPQIAGLCSVAISDANAQQATMNVQVMGTLGITPASLVLTSGGSGQTAALSKTFDSAALQGAVVSSTCAGIAKFTFTGGTAPAQPGTQPATATLTVTPQSIGVCTAQIGDQYATFGDPPATLNVAVLAPPTPAPTPIPTPVPTRSPTPTPVPTRSPTPTPLPCPTGASTFIGADKSCDDLYLWPVDAWECAEFNCALLYLPPNDSAPPNENLWAGVYVPHGTVVNYDIETNATEPYPAYYVSYAQVNSPVTPVIFAYYYSDGSHPSQAVANPAGFGLTRIANAASIPHDPAQAPVSLGSYYENRLPAPTFTIAY